VESYVEGTEIHVDGIWQHGTLRWSSVGEYFRPVIACTRGAQLADYILSPTQGSALLVQKAQRFAAACLEGLAAPDCVFHLEAFHTADGLVFGECAARLAGAKIPEIIDGTHGVDLYDAVVATALDEAAADAITPKPPVVLFAYVYLEYDIGLRPPGGRRSQSVKRFFGLDLWEEFVRVELGRAPGFHLPMCRPTGYCGVIGMAASPQYDGRPQLNGEELRALPGVVEVHGGTRRAREEAKLGSSVAYTHTILFDCAGEEKARELILAIETLGQAR
jgi:hypothetical protein